MDVQGLLEWLNATCKEARIAALEGNVDKANQLARVPALRDYFNNVVMTEKVSGETFVQWYPAYTAELYALYEDYLKQAKLTETVTTQDAKLAELTQKYDEMKAQIAKLLEARTATETADEEEPKPRKRKARKDSGDEEPADPAAEPDAEEGADDAPETTED